MTEILYITDGTDEVDLLHGGFRLEEWNPSIPQEKGGGVWRSSFFSDGRVPVMEGPYDNAIETFKVIVNSKNPNATIRDTQNLRRLCRKAKDYFATKRTTQPVWIVAKANRETNTRYAIIYGWQTGPDGGPFTSPFTNLNQAAMVDFTLILERGHWRSTEPGDSDCIAVTQPPEYTIQDEQTYETAQNTDDCYTEWENELLTWVATQIELGFAENVVGYYDDVSPVNDLMQSTGIVFPNVTPVNAAKWVASATLRVVASQSNAGATALPLRIYGFAEDDTATFSTAANYSARPVTVAFYDAFSGAWTAGTVYEADVTDIVNEIVSRSGWSAGNNIGFRIDGIDGNTYTKYIAARENLTYDPPELDIEWVDSRSTSIISCDPIIVTNQYSGYDIDFFYYYSNPYWIALSYAYPPFEIIPKSMTGKTGDILYFGCTKPFGVIVFNIGTATPHISAIDWEYWNGAAWVDINDERDNTVRFSTLGKNTITWVPLSQTGWAKTTINSLNAYWVRGVLTVSSVTPTHPVQTRWRVANHPLVPYIHIPANPTEEPATDQTYPYGVGGDMPALLKISAEYQGQYSYLSEPYGMSIGERTYDDDRRLYFNAYINLSNYAGTFPPFPTIDLTLGDDCAYADYLGGPGGRSVLYNPNDTAFAERVRVRLGTSTTEGVQSYIGRHHAYLRLSQVGGATGDFYYQLNVCGVYTEKKYFTDYPIIDFGVVEITGNRKDTVGEYTVIILGANTSGSPGDCYLQELILIPVDQYVGRFEADGYPEYAGYGDTIVVDSAETSSQDIDAHIDDGYLDYIMQKDSSGPVTIVNNKTARIWFLFSKEIRDHVFKVRLYKSQRYLSARGDR